MNPGESCSLVYHCRDYTSNQYIRFILKMIVTPYCWLKYFYVPNIPNRKGMAFILIAKKEAPYVEEWINFHFKQGVSHFIIYDNESTDNLHEVLMPYINSGFVTYHLIKGKIRQVDAYNMAIADYGKKFKYMGFIDGDEFVFVRKNTYGVGTNLYEFIDAFMNEHPNAGGITINWCLFGSNGHETKPEGGVLENYTRCAKRDYEENRWIKTICDPVKVLACFTPHVVYLRLGFYNLNENGELSENQKSTKILFDKIRINHYMTKSKQEFIAKKHRGKADGFGLRPLSDFNVNNKNDIHDTEILSRA